MLLDFAKDFPIYQTLGEEGILRGLDQQSMETNFAKYSHIAVTESLEDEVPVNYYIRLYPRKHYLFQFEPCLV